MNISYNLKEHIWTKRLKKYKLYEKNQTYLTVCSLTIVLRYKTHQYFWASLRNKGTWLIPGDNSFDDGHTITDSLRERTWVWSDCIQELKAKSRTYKASGINVRAVQHSKALVHTHSVHAGMLCHKDQKGNLVSVLNQRV